VHRSERDKNPAVPVQAVRLIRILDAASQITQKVKCIIHGIVDPGTDRSWLVRLWCPASGEDFQAYLQVGGDLF
jgi:hypothetical protein